VGAQSIAPALSTAHGQIGDSISQKSKFLKNFLLQKKKNGKKQQILEQNITILT
jgi:hypothetical protein